MNAFDILCDFGIGFIIGVGIAVKLMCYFFRKKLQEIAQYGSKQTYNGNSFYSLMRITNMVKDLIKTF